MTSFYLKSINKEKIKIKNYNIKKLNMKIIKLK